MDFRCIDGKQYEDKLEEGNEGKYIKMVFSCNKTL